MRATFWRRLARRVGLRLFSWAENNGDPRIAANGEKWFLSALLVESHPSRCSEPLVFIDAGANRGDYSTMVVEMADSAKREVEVHAFEPSSTCVQALRAAFHGRPTVHIIEAALSDHSGKGLLHGEDGSTQASLVSRTGIVHSHGAITVQLVALADYFIASGLKRIDLLKLDVEGSELTALVGLREYLSPDIVDIIQFEYGGTSLDARTSLRELYTLLTSRGYVLAKLLPSAVEVRDYSDCMENYAYANYLALSPRWIAPQSRRA